MTLDRNMALLLATPLIGLIVPVTVFFWKTPPVDLSRTERELLQFSSQPLLVSRPADLPSYSGAQSPIAPPKPKQVLQAKGAFPPVPSATGTKRGVQTSAPRIPRVSMIYNDSGSRMAIIDDQVLREGSAVSGHIIVKIDKTRVLARTNGKEIWLSLD